MRRLALALMLPTICLSIHAEQTGRISGKVLNKEGKPIPGSKVNLKRVDRNWSKDLIPDKNGNFLQVGLEPKDFTLTVTAEGYVTYTESPVKIPLADVIVQGNIVQALGPARYKYAVVIAGGRTSPS